MATEDEDVASDKMQVLRYASQNAPRLARITFSSRTIDTPHYLASTSRGVVPHLTPDTLTRSSQIRGVYMSLEDFLERSSQTPPILTKDDAGHIRSIRDFTALPDSQILALGLRRNPPVVAPSATSNTNDAVAISTSTGFQFVGAQEYANQVDQLDADITTSLADVPYGRSLSSKRIAKAVDRSIEWLKYHLRSRQQLSHGKRSQLYVSLLPVSCEHQKDLVEVVEEQALSETDGLAIYNIDTLHDLPTQLSHLPRLGFTEPKTPLQALQHIQVGIDILTLPFIDIATDAGLALTFSFPGTLDQGMPQPLCVDMWSVSHAIDLSPLVKDCQCYACTDHHRAYIQHLLSAKEMLGWVLLQIHNYSVIDRFFEDIRESIARGTFATDIDNFAKAYDADLPAGTGAGPRVRGYQRKSEGLGEPKLNPPSFRKLTDEGARSSEARARTVAKISGLTDDLDMMLAPMED